MEAMEHVDFDIVSRVETDNRSDKLMNEDETGIGRAYECTFCKRGFTNAQALGGHMNIHRKDKAKVKKRLINGEEPSNPSTRPVEKYLNSRCFPHVSSSHEGHQVSYHQVYLPSSNPSTLSQSYYQRNIINPVWRPEERRFIDYMKVNLSMTRIGLPPLVDHEEGYIDRMISQENEVDLELRLGHDP